MGPRRRGSRHEHAAHSGAVAGPSNTARRSGLNCMAGGPLPTTADARFVTARLGGHRMRSLIALAAVILIAPAAGAQDWAKAKLEKSPRHQEWVKVKHGDRTVNSFLVYPESKGKATAVVVIHEIFGLTDWVRD